MLARVYAVRYYRMIPVECVDTGRVIYYIDRTGTRI